MRPPRIRTTSVLASAFALTCLVAACTSAPSAPAPTATSVSAPKPVQPTSPPAAPAATTVARPAAAAPTASSAEQPVKGGTLTASIGIHVADTLNQHTSSWTITRVIAHHVLDSLVAVDARDGTIKPSLAESWDVSPDGKTYTFHLRKDVKFHDATPFNAQAVKYNFDYTAKSDVKHGFAWQALGADNYAGTEVVDESTARVNFKAPYPTFLANLSDGGMGIDSPTAMEKAGADYGVKSLVGSGPYKFQEWVKDTRVVLVRNDDYHWPPAIARNQRAPYLDQITFRDIGDTDTRIASLETGETQVIAMTEPQVAQVKAEKDIQVLTTPKAGTTRMYLMNVAKFPTDDVMVRQALNYAVDKQTLLKLPAWSSIGNPAVAPLPANMFPGGTIPTSLKQLDYGFSLDKARALLDQAGWVAGADGMRQKNGKPLVLDAVTVPMFTNQVEPIDQMFRKVGAQLNIRTGDFNFIVSSTKGGDYNLWITSDSGYDASAMVYEYFNTKGTSARTGYQNPDVDKALDTALRATNPKDLWDNLTIAQAQVLKDAVGIMGWEQLYVYGARSTAHDVGYSEIGYPWFYDTWLSK